MTYKKHGRVDDIIEQHDTRMLGISQPLGVQDFGYYVMQAIPGCRISPESSSWSWVYMPDDHYAMGLIGYGNVSMHGTGNETYNVMSHNIANGKFSDHSKQYNIRSSTKREAAVKNAKTHLRRYSLSHVAEYTVPQVRRAVSDMKNTLRSDRFKLETAIFGSTISSYRNDKPLAYTELMCLFNSGHTFADPTLQESLQKYEAMLEEYNNTEGNYNMWFVTVTSCMGKQRVDVAPMDRIEAYPAQIGPAETYYDDVPEDIAGKVAVLSMVEEDHYVHGVGIRVMQGVYYVAR